MNKQTIFILILLALVIMLVSFNILQLQETRPLSISEIRVFEDEDHGKLIYINRRGQFFITDNREYLYLSEEKNEK